MQDAELDQIIEIFLRPERKRETLEERVTALEDREAIREVLMGYGFLCDRRRWDDLFELYADDIERVLGGTLTERVKGKEALRPLYEAPALPRADEDDAGPPPAEQLNSYELRHLIVSDFVRLDDEDHRRGWAAASYSMVVSTEAGGFQRGQHEGGYIFEMRKEDDGRWVVAKMTVFSENARNPLFQAK